jgi:hypothetical protein
LVYAVLKSLAEQRFRRIVVWRGYGGHDLRRTVKRFNEEYKTNTKVYLPVTLTTISGVDLATPQTEEDKKSLIIADFLGSGKEEKKLLQNYHQLLKKGAKYVKPSNIVMNLLTAESHLNPAFQVADLVVGITTGMCTPKRNYALPYWDIVKRDFHHNQNSAVMG